MPQDLEDRMVFLCPAGMFKSVRMVLTTLGTEPQDRAKSTTQVRPYIPPYLRTASRPMRALFVAMASMNFHIEALNSLSSS